MIETYILINGVNGKIENSIVDPEDIKVMHEGNPCPRMAIGDVFWFDSELTENRYELTVTKAVLEMMKEEYGVAPSWFQTIYVDLSERCGSNWM